ncbi:MAG: peptide MFS transporter [Candidatus Lernaella stagnicola]|nr:peptide MFS transporter [Candidatus Lernaella stagnicola]
MDEAIPVTAKGHPKGLYLLFLVEMWERFSYYGMRALLVLYMTKSLLFSTEKAGTIYGWYTGFVYLTPLLGGYIADRYWGARKCITIGAILMALGHFAMAFETLPFFYSALLLLIFGNGFFKPNISTTVGRLYKENDPRRDGGFTIFYMGINLGALFSPLVCGTLGEKLGWHFGFSAAGVGMVFGLLLYLWGQKKLLGNAGMVPEAKPSADLSKKAVPLTTEEKHRIAVIFILAFFVIFFWASFEQAGSSLTLFADRSTDRNIDFLGWEFPTSWFQAVNPFFILLLAPIFSALWTRLGRRSKDPSIPLKMALGLAILTFGMVLMVMAGTKIDSGADGGFPTKEALAASEIKIEQEAAIDAAEESGQEITFAPGERVTDEQIEKEYKTDVQVSILWLILAYFLFTAGELCLSPIGLSAVTKLSPVRFGSLMMGTWFGANFLSNLVGGLFAGNYDGMTKSNFFIIPVGTAAAASVILFLVAPKLKKWMHGVH